MENIKVFDNFLDDNEISKLNKIIEITEFDFVQRSSKIDKNQVIFFSSYKYDDFFNNYIKNKFENKLNKKFILERNYINSQTFGMEGGFHIDSHSNTYYTYCIYLTKYTNDEIDNIGGEFFIKVPNTKYILSFETYNNRGIFFPAKYLHKGMTYNCLSNETRICITWKLKEII